MDSDMPLHSFLVYTLLLAAAIGLITVWDRRTEPACWRRRVMNARESLGRLRRRTWNAS
jgi:hypothetical protein